MRTMKWENGVFVGDYLSLIDPPFFKTKQLERESEKLTRQMLEVKTMGSRRPSRVFSKLNMIGKRGATAADYDEALV